MKWMTQKVLERLNYEKLLMIDGITPRRNRITLDEILEAAQNEVRIYIVLPALIVYKPSAIYHLNKDLPKHPEIQKVLAVFFEPLQRPKKFFKIDILDCIHAAATYRRFLEHKKTKTKFKTFTFRLANQDIEQLKSLSIKMETYNLSDTLRSLVKEKSKRMGLTQ